MSTIWACDGIENKHDVFRGENWKNRFRKSVIKHAMKIINSENAILIDLTNKQTAGTEEKEKTKICYICKKRLSKNRLMIKIIANFKTFVIIW